MRIESESMVKKTAKEEKSDGIEIISIGKLYTGPWDKKYWSSSRGKDRYPYPIGYKSVRTQNGVTYTMEILEGLKGPLFMISSTDGKSCSGDTPDIAWENFQKKSFSKLWHGKRSSCKIDGVEFFGFKNTFVQRLLREPVADVGGTAEQSLSSSNFSSGACETVDQLQCKPSGPDPNSLIHSAKAHVRGKRSKIEKVVNNKRLNETNFKRRKEKCIKKASSSLSKQRHQSYCGHDPSSSAAPNEDLTVITENEKCPPVAERGMRMDSVDISDHLIVGDSLSQEEKELTPTNHFEYNVGNLLQNQEPSDSSRYVVVQEFTSIIPQQSGVANVQHDLSVVNDSDMYAPDTLDHVGDRSAVCSPKDDLQVHGIVSVEVVQDVAKYEVLATDSLPEDETCSPANNTSSENCHTDSVGQGLAKSMMTLLLPRAVPLLKTFTRKKKKTEKPTNHRTHRSQEKNNMPSISMDGATTVRGLAGQSDVGEKVCTSSAGHDSVLSTTRNSDFVVPGSLDNEDPQPVLPHADAAKAGRFSCGLVPPATQPANVNAEANLLKSGIRKRDIYPHCQRQAAFSDKPKIDTGTADTLGVATDIDLAPVKEIKPNPKRARFDCQSLNKVPPYHASITQGTSRSESMISRNSSHISMHVPEKSEASKLPEDADFCGRDNPSSKLRIPSTSGCCSLTESNKTNDNSRLNARQNVKLNSEPRVHLELLACYAHPMPISMVQLIVKENEVFVCVVCGYSEQRESTLFFYKALMNGEEIGCPSLMGHAPISFQNSENNLDRDIAVQRSFLQLAPDAKSLVLLNRIKTPYCRESKLHCSCQACTSDCFGKNAVKIIRLNRGYVTLVTRLQTSQCVCCLLVCGSSFLLAAEEGGKLKLWVMNSGWSGQKEECYLPTLGCSFPGIVELKTIPKSASLVVGHNGFGEFGLWDIDNRNLVSKFSSPGMSVMGSVPVSVFRWQRKGECKPKALVDEIMDATRMAFSGGNENHVFSPEDKDVAVWVLISTVTSPDSQPYQSCEQEEAKLGGCWRLALLVNNMVITGSAMDEGAAAATSTGHGIIGRCDGLIYMWELSTGMKLGNIHSFKGSRVSCITTDISSSGALAVASEGQLLVYLPS
ncbi:hypothetical protein OROHE_014969 [Orobanche hederae]